MVSPSILFYAGLVIVAHSVYIAFSIREQLQALHHGHRYIPAVSFGAVSVPTSTMMFPIAIEVLAGMVLAIIGFVQCNTLQRARLSDVTKFLRYDNQLNTGVGFIHFNHRGTIACKKDELNDGQKPMSQKKAD